MKASCVELLAGTLMGMTFLGGCDRPQASKEARHPVVGAAAPAPAAALAAEDSLAIIEPPGTGRDVIIRRPDWDAFRAALPSDRVAAASALDDYRQRYGLPLDFTLDDKASDSVKRVLGLADVEDEMGCGLGVTAYVRSVAARHPLLHTSPVIEFDSAGRTLQWWPMPALGQVGAAIAGVSGEELVTTYDGAPEGIYLRLRPSGDFRMSAEPPAPLPAELWLLLDDSSWVRVRPNDNMGRGRGRASQSPGRWVPKGNAGWYVRVDSSPYRGDSARAQPAPFAPSPENIVCPAAGRFDGMHCLAFPDAGRQRRIAAPIPCT